MNSINRLTELFSKFPGIGPRQAKRFVYHLLTRNPEYNQELARLILQIRETIQECDSCHRFFERPPSGIRLCEICRNPSRDDSVLIVVSRDVDLENIEKTHVHTGKYFVAGGTIPILEKNPEQKIRMPELSKTVEERAQQGALKEIILAMNLTPDGENTGDYIERSLKPITNQYGIKISHLGKGISTGTEIEYSDSETIKNALKNRQ